MLAQPQIVKESIIRLTIKNMRGFSNSKALSPSFYSYSNNYEFFLNIYFNKIIFAFFDILIINKNKHYAQKNVLNRKKESRLRVSSLLVNSFIDLNINYVFYITEIM